MIYTIVKSTWLISDFFDYMETTATFREENTLDANQAPPPSTGLPDLAACNLKSQIECIKVFVKELQAAADDYSKEVNRSYEPGSWQEECAAKLKIARDILDVLVTFLETRGGHNITEQLLATFTLRIKTFAELLGPVMASFCISVYMCYADARLHKSNLMRFSEDIRCINLQLERLKQIMPRLTNMIAEAGEQLKAFIQVCSIKYFNILLKLTQPVGGSVN